MVSQSPIGLTAPSPELVEEAEMNPRFLGGHGGGRRRDGVWQVGREEQIPGDNPTLYLQLVRPKGS